MARGRVQLVLLAHKHNIGNPENFKLNWTAVATTLCSSSTVTHQNVLRDTTAEVYKRFKHNGHLTKARTGANAGAKFIIADAEEDPRRDPVDDLGDDLGDDANGDGPTP